MPPPVAPARDVPARAEDAPAEIAATLEAHRPAASRGLAGLDLALLAVVLCVAAAWRLLFVSTGAPTFVTPDSDDYLRPGYELARGLGFEPELRRTPLYSLFVALVLAAGGNLGALALTQHVLGVATAALTYGLGRATFGPVAGAIAGLAVAVSGPLLVYEHYVMAEALFTLLVTAAAFALVLASRRGTTACLFAAGAVMGLAALTRPVGQALIPVSVVVAMLLALPRLGTGLRHAALVALGAAVVLAPWAGRNLVVHGTIGAEGALGQALIGRTIRHDRGYVYDDPARPEPDPVRAAARRIIQEEARGGEPSGGTITARVRDELGLTQAQTSTLLRDLAIDAIARRPGHFAASTLETSWELFQGKNERLLGHWRQRTTRNWDRKWEPELVALLDAEHPAEGDAYERADELTSAFQPWRWRWPITWLFALGALAALVLPRYRAGLLPLAAAVALVLAAGALDGLVWRFRYPADPLIAVVAAGGLIAPIAVVGGRLLTRER